MRKFIPLRCVCTFPVSLLVTKDTIWHSFVCLFYSCWTEATEVVRAVMLLSWCSFTTQFSIPSWRCAVCHQGKVTQASTPSPSHPQPPLAADQQSHQLGSLCENAGLFWAGLLLSQDRELSQGLGQPHRYGYQRWEVAVSTDGQGEIHFWKRQHLSLVQDRSSLSAQAAPLAGCAPCRPPGASVKGFLRGRLTLTAGL